MAAADGAAARAGREDHGEADKEASGEMEVVVSH